MTNAEVSVASPATNTRVVLVTRPPSAPFACDVSLGYSHHSQTQNPRLSRIPSPRPRRFLHNLLTNGTSQPTHTKEGGFSGLSSGHICTSHVCACINPPARIPSTRRFLWLVGFFFQVRSSSFGNNRVPVGSRLLPKSKIDLGPRESLDEAESCNSPSAPHPAR